jgi:hypothetical protein
MERYSDQDGFDQDGLGDLESSNPVDDPEMMEPDADPLDTDVEDADLFLGLVDDDGYADDDDDF